MPDEVKLKPCPFCRCENITIRKDKIQFHELFPWTAKCGDCHMSIGGFRIEKDAVDEWNHRPLEDAKDARIAELEKRLAEATTWRSPESAPKDVLPQKFLGLFLESGPVVVSGPYKTDSYMDTAGEAHKASYLTGWLPLPKEESL